MRTLSNFALLGLAACAPKTPRLLDQPDLQGVEDVSDAQMEAEIAAEERARAAREREATLTARKAVETETALVTGQVQDRCGISLAFVPGTQYGRPSASADYVASTPQDAACVYEVAREEHCSVEILPISSRTSPSAVGSVVCTGWDGTMWNLDGIKTVQVGL